MKSLKYKIGGLILAGSLGLASFSYDDRYFEIAKNLDIFATLFKELNGLYVDEVNPNRVMQLAIENTLKQFDPYTNFYAEDDIEDYMTMTTGKYNGIGALVGTRDGKKVIMRLYEGAPALKAGLKVGDEIVKIEGIELGSRKDVDPEKLLKGQGGTDVKISVRREGSPKLIDVKVNRGVVTMENVPYSGMISDEVGLIYLDDFSATAAKEVRGAFIELKGKGMKKLILDLRGNPGGLLNMAIDISNLFIPKDQLVVETRGKVAEWNKKYNSMNAPYDLDIPMVVLINSSSASASEIVSGVIQDYDRGVLIGQRSYGKGLVQTTKDLSYRTKLKVTTAKYYIPSGRCIQAIDYSHRNADGSVGKIPDSLMTAFKTRAGRVVYDGGGVDPDVKVEAQPLASVTQSLISNFTIFDYATLFCQKNESIKNVKEFSLSDDQYNDFVKWLVAKKVDYTSPIDKDLKSLEASAKKEKYYTTLEEQINAMKAKILSAKQRDLQVYKDEIKFQLENEIISRYYYQKGQKEFSFRHDPEVKEALKVLADTDRYHKILKAN